MKSGHFWRAERRQMILKRTPSNLDTYVQWG